jgi:soluble lytic murein transglycosylase-like protein
MERLNMKNKQVSHFTTIMVTSSLFLGLAVTSAIRFQNELGLNLIEPSKPVKLTSLSIVNSDDRVSSSNDFCYYDLAEYWAKIRKIDPTLVKAVIHKESSCDPKALGKAKDSPERGLMQIKPITAIDLGNKPHHDLYNPGNNIKLGTLYLKKALDKCNQKESCALKLYNRGINTRFPEKGAVYALSVLKIKSSLKRQLDKSLKV